MEENKLKLFTELREACDKRKRIQNDVFEKDRVASIRVLKNEESRTKTMLVQVNMQNEFEGNLLKSTLCESESTWISIYVCIASMPFI